MNDVTKDFWSSYWEKRDEVAPSAVSAWQFGDNPDYLAQLVVDGLKTATCSGFVFYQEEEPLPKVGEFSILLDSRNEPVAIIETTSVEILPFRDVPVEFAIAEGEGDRTYAYWRRVHIDFFTEDYKTTNEEFTEDSLVVCERFRLLSDSVPDNKRNLMSYD